MQAPGVVVSTELMLGLPSQASLAVGSVKTGVAGQLIVASAPWPLSIGAVVSITVMVWLTGTDTLPQASVALQVLFKV